MAIDWKRLVLTEHMTEAAAVVGQCRVVLDFGATDRVCYEITVHEALKGAGDDPYFAVGTNRDDPGGFHPLGAAATPEEAVQLCLERAGVHHRRLVKQKGEA